MNKKELAEIRKNFNDNSGFFTLNHVLTAYVDPQKNILCKDNKLYALIPEDEGAVMMESLKKVLSGSLGKNLVEYGFPEEEYDEGGAQNDLYNAVRFKLEDAEFCDKLLTRIVNNMAFPEVYTIIIGYCSYSIMSRDENDEDCGDGSDEYNFIVTAICPASTGNDGLIFDKDKASIIKKDNKELLISRAPTDGFLYPVFSDRCTDINNVMYYSKNAKKPNISIVEDVLGCEFSMTCQNEKDAFGKILSEALRDDLSYTVVTRVNEELSKIAANYKNETELPRIGADELVKILSETGVSEDKLEAVPAVFKENVPNGEGLTAVNLTESKTVIKASEVTVSIDNCSADKVWTSVQNGRKCLIIDLDDPNVTVNDINVKL